MSTQVGVSVTHTGRWTGEVAEVLVVMLRTLAPAVTDMRHKQTDSGATTSVESRAGTVFTTIIIISQRTVIHTIAAYIQGQADART